MGTSVSGTKLILRILKKGLDAGDERIAHALGISTSNMDAIKQCSYDDLDWLAKKSPDIVNIKLHNPHMKELMQLIERDASMEEIEKVTNSWKILPFKRP